MAIVDRGNDGGLDCQLRGAAGPLLAEAVAPGDRDRIVDAVSSRAAEASAKLATAEKAENGAAPRDHRRPAEDEARGEFQEHVARGGAEVDARYLAPE